MKREDLEQQALQSVCACYHYHLADTVSETPDDELKEIIEDSYALHTAIGETWKDCPEWAMEREEVLADMQIMEMLGK